MTNIILRYASGLVEGDGSNDVIVIGYSDNATIVGGGGNDLITVLSGDATIYGSIPPVSIAIPLNLELGTGSTPEITLPASLTTYGNDTIIVGSGNDVIYGSTGGTDLFITYQTTYAAAGQDVSSFFNFFQQNQTYGSDLIIAGSGNDTITGGTGFAGIHAVVGIPVMVNGVDVGVSANGPQSIADGINAQSTATFWVTNTTFTYGNDTIIGGRGNDVINGDQSAIATDGGAGQAIALNGGVATTHFLHAGETFLFGADTIFAGSGNTQVYGDGQFHSDTVYGGVAIADGIGSKANVSDLVGPALGFANTVTDGGNNHLYGGSGNDEIFGDFQFYYNELVGGSATATNGGVASSSFIINDNVVDFGNNYIVGGTGTGTGTGTDLLVGNVLSTTLELTPGIATQDSLSSARVVTEIKDFLQVMGDNTIIAGSSNDTIIGDALDFKLLSQNLAASLTPGGTHVQVTDQLVYPSGDASNNTIVWGNDLLYGGSGHDNFVTTLTMAALPSGHQGLITQGFERIFDFNKANDTLTFVGVNASTFYTHTFLSHSGVNTVINFDLGSITLEHVNVPNLSDLHISFLSDSSSIHNAFHV